MNILFIVLIFISFDNVKGPEKPVSFSQVHFHRFSLLFDFNTLHFLECILDFVLHTTEISSLFEHLYICYTLINFLNVNLILICMLSACVYLK